MTLRNASGGVAVAGLVMMGTLLVLRQRKRTQDAARPVDRGFPPG